jgi:hydroxymethylpyrimidine pyrophosphatase-like HAD family hydrolase
MIDAAFIFDIDGTLYLHREGANGDFTALMQAISGEGSLFAVATSRPLSDVLAIFQGTTLPYLAICNDGALSFRVEPDDRIELLDSIPVQNVFALVQPHPAQTVFSDPIVFTISASGEGPVMLPRRSDCLTESLVALTPGRDYCRYENLSDALGECRARGLQVRSLAYFIPTELAARYSQDAHTIASSLAQARVLSYVDTRVFNGYWHEVVNCSLGKQSAIARLKIATHLPQRIIASGNAWNDLEMLKSANVAVVPHDAEQEALKVAHVVASTPGGTGFVTWMIDNHGRLLNESLRL